MVADGSTMRAESRWVLVGWQSWISRRPVISRWHLLPGAMSSFIMAKYIIIPTCVLKSMRWGMLQLGVVILIRKCCWRRWIDGELSQHYAASTACLPLQYGIAGSAHYIWRGIGWAKSRFTTVKREGFSSSDLNSRCCARTPHFRARSTAMPWLFFSVTAT